MDNELNKIPATSVSKGSQSPWVWWRSRILVIGAVVLMIFVVFPPWHYWINQSGVHRSVPAFRSPILEPPIPKEPYSVGIDFGRMGIELFMVIGFTGIALLIRARTKTKASN